MPLMEWSSKYAIHIKEIDEQHRRLFALVNKMDDAVKNSMANEITVATLEELIEYTIYHFNMEEELIKKNNYPKIKTHKLEHDNFTHQVLRFKTEYKKSNGIDCNDFLKFLSEWLKKHTTSSDLEYAQYISKYGKY